MAGQAQEPCAGDCGQAQVVSAAAQLERDRNQFVAAVRQLIEAIPDASGGDRNAVAASVDQLARALAGWDKSIRTYRAVLLDVAERAADAHVALAGVYLERGNGREALKEAQAARALDPQRADAYILLGLAYDLAKRPADAALAFSNASKLSPRSPAATYGLAQRLIAAGDEAGATAALRRFDASQSAVAFRCEWIGPPTGFAVRARGIAAAIGGRRAPVPAGRVCEGVCAAGRRRLRAGDR